MRRIKNVMDEIHWINKKAGNYRCLRCGFQCYVIEAGSPAQHLKHCRVAKKIGEVAKRQLRIARMIQCALEEAVNNNGRLVGEPLTSRLKFVKIVLQYGGSARPHLRAEEVERVLDMSLGDIVKMHLSPIA